MHEHQWEIVQMPQTGSIATTPFRDPNHMPAGEWWKRAIPFGTAVECPAHRSRRPGAFEERSLTARPPGRGERSEPRSTALKEIAHWWKTR